MPKKLKISLGLIVFLVVLRVALAPITRVVINSYLKDFSPTLVAQVGDVDMAIIRGSFTIENIRAKVKKDDREFLYIRAVNADLSWRDFATNLLIKRLEFNLIPSLMPAVKEHLASIEDKPNEAPKDSRFRVPRIDLIDSLIRAEKIVVAQEINARMSNAIPTESSPLSPFNVRGKLMGDGELKIEGELDLYAKNPQWSIDSEILHFKMDSLNPFLRQAVPITFTKGELDLYSEAKSEKGVIEGYIKPFVKGLDVIKSNENFKDTKHWLIEIISALGNTTLKSDEVMATKISFSYDQEFKVDTGETIQKAITHGFVQEQSRGIENSISLKQAQEDEE